MHIYIYTPIHTYLSLSVYLSIYVFIDLFIYFLMFIYIYIYNIIILSIMLCCFPPYVCVWLMGNYVPMAPAHKSTYRRHHSWFHGGPRETGGHPTISSNESLYHSSENISMLKDSSIPERPVWKTNKTKARDNVWTMEYLEAKLRIPRSYLLTAVRMTV